MSMFISNFLLLKKPSLSINIYFYWPEVTSSDKDSILFQNICVLCNLGLNVLLSQLGQFSDCLFLGVAELSLLFSLLLQGGCDSLVLPANLMCQTPKDSKLT